MADQVIEFEGVQHTFPEDFTEEEISTALSSYAGSEPTASPLTDEDRDSDATALESKHAAQAFTVGFSEALEYVRPNEGGYVNDPDDPGGETNLGISKRSYPDEDIKNMTEERSAEIFQRDFWDRPKLGKLPDRLATKVFDSCVHVGNVTCVKLLQEQLGVTQTGIVNDATIKAVEKEGEDAVLKGYVSTMKGYYKDIAKRKPASKKYLKGWIARAERLPDKADEEG